jgi:fructokinase
MEQAHLFPMIRRKTQDVLNGYVHAPEILERIDEFIVPPGLGNKAGVCGCIALGQKALTASS